MGKRIRPEQAAHVATRIETLGFNVIILTGGDPLHSRLKQETYVLIRELKNRDLRVIVNTSAALLTDSDLDTIVALGIDRVDISIDSHRPEIHNSQRGCYDDAVKAITGFVNRGYRSIATTIVVTGANASSLTETILWLRSLGVEDVRIQRAFLPSQSKGVCSSIVLGMREACSLLVSHPHVREYIELTERAFNGEAPSARASCRMGKEFFVCDATGVLTPCFHRSDLVLGNLFEDHIDQLKQIVEFNVLTGYRVPPCFGSHCVSLFDNPRFWRDEDGGETR